MDEFLEGFVVHDLGDNLLMLKHEVCGSELPGYVDTRDVPWTTVAVELITKAGGHRCE